VRFTVIFSEEVDRSLGTVRRQTPEVQTVANDVT
jgi:hypothetical protein